jgi:hypothetical protein
MSHGNRVKPLRYLVESLYDGVPQRFEVTIELQALVHQLGARAMRNASGSTAEVYGAVKVTHLNREDS